MEHQKQKKEEPLTVGRFWEKYPKLIVIKSFLILTGEAALLGYSLYAVIQESNVTYCEPPNDEERTQIKNGRAVNQLKASLYMMSFSNFYNIACMLNKILVKYGCVSKKKTIISYCLLDCYCCVASFCGLYCQICYINFKNYCNAEQTITKEVLLIEILWIYIQLFMMFIFTCIGICVILYRQRQKAKAQLQELKKRELQEMARKLEQERQIKELELRTAELLANKSITGRRRQNVQIAKLQTASPLVEKLDIPASLAKSKKTKKKKKVLRQIFDEGTRKKNLAPVLPVSPVALRGRVRAPLRIEELTLEMESERNFLVRDEPSELPRSPGSLKTKPMLPGQAFKLPGQAFQDQSESKDSQSSVSVTDSFV